VQVDKDEWKTFLAEFSELTKNYELILGKLELAHTQMKELNQRNENLARELRRPVPEAPGTGESKGEKKEPVKEVQPKVESKHSFLQALRARLDLSRRAPQIQVGYASCQKCGFLVRRASRFCVGCGADFGSIVCPCGRALSSSDKFCDRCRRATGLQ